MTMFVFMVTVIKHTLSIIANTAVADPKAVANVCSSGSALPREKLPITTPKNTFRGGERIND